MNEKKIKKSLGTKIVFYLIEYQRETLPKNEEKKKTGKKRRENQEIIIKMQRGMPTCIFRNTNKKRSNIEYQ